jgi:hypothetical protein
VLVHGPFDRVPNHLGAPLTHWLRRQSSLTRTGSPLDYDQLRATLSSRVFVIRGWIFGHSRGHELLHINAGNARTRFHS